MRRDRPVVVFVGAFPPEGSPIHGGNVTACRALLASSLPDQAELQLVDSTQRSIPAPPLPVRAWYGAARALKVLGLLRRRPDAILMFAGGGLGLMEKAGYAWVARLAGVRSLLFVRAGDVMDRARRSSGYRRLVRALFSRVDRLLCQGESWRQFFVEDLRFTSERCPVIMNWTATRELLEIGAARAYPERRPVRALFVGWLAESKGLFELLAAVAALEAESPGSIVLDVAGDGEATERARRFVAERGLDRVVTFHGWVSGNRKNDLFAAADLLALPSHHEGLPNALIEAMAAGLPALVTPVGCVLDAVTDGRDALVIPVRNVEALTNALRRLVGSAALRERLGRAAFRRAEDQFAVEGAVERLTTVVHEVLRDRGRA